MAYNIVVPSTNPVMGGGYIVPPSSTVIGGTLVVPPANPRMSNFMAPSSGMIAGNIVVPTTNHVIRPAGGVIVGGNFIRNPSLFNTGVAPFGWNTFHDFHDHFRRTVNAVEYLGRHYEGVMRCKKCQTSVTFDGKAIVTHEQKCRYSTNKFPAQQHPNVENCKISTIEMFKKFMQSGVVETKSDNANPPPSEYMNLLLSRVDRTSFIISQFECLVCLKRGDIAQWEEHVVKFHKNDSQPCNDEQRFEITCICFVCDCLLLGTQKSVREHTHRGINMDVSRCASISNVIALYPSLHPNDVTLSRYHKFTMKTTGAPAITNEDYFTKMAFYCSACDFYSLKRIDKHFSSFEHKMHSVLSDELRQCEVCHVVLSSDALLMAVHRLTPSHLIRKCREIPNMLDVWSETDVHHALMKSVQRRFNEHHFDSVSQRLAYFCSLCNFAALQRSDWQAHMTCDEHLKNVSRFNVVQPVDFVCASCKITLFGSIFLYLGHVATKGHKLIKRGLVSCYNLQQLQLPQRQKVKAVVEQPQPRKEVAEVADRPVDTDSAHLSDLLLSVLLGDDSDETKKENANADGVAYQPPRVFRRRKERSDSETGSQSRRSQRVALWKTRSESESSAVSQRNSGPVVKSITSAPVGRAPEAALVESELKVALEPPRSPFETVPKSEEFAPAVTPRAAAATAVFNAPAVVSVAASQNLRLIRRSLSATPNLNHNNGKSEDDESDCFYDCDESDERISCHSSSSSDNDAEKTVIRVCTNGDVTFDDDEEEEEVEIGAKHGDEIENEDEEDDVNDLYEDILTPDENECNAMVSDEEMDASVLNELKKDANGLDGANHAENNSENGLTNDENRVIVRHLIVVRGIPKQAIKNKRIMYTTFSRFGEIHRTYVKKSEPDSLYILVLKNPEAMYQRLRENLVFLKVKLGAEEINVEYNTRNSDGPGVRIELTKEAQLLFSNANELENAVQYLMQVYETETKSTQSQARISKLGKTVNELAKNLYRDRVSTKVHIFGSRVTGLATEKSDVDIYLQLGNSFDGCMHTMTILQQRLVLAFSNRMKMFPKQFENVISVPFARVPIVKFTDVKAGLNCDLSFKSGLSTMNSILVRTYLELDVRVKYLVCAVKLWMKLNNFADRHLFTTYAQVWMVLFFLMQAEVAVVPTVLQLRFMLPSEQQEFNIEGWNCAFPNIGSILWRSSCTLTKKELLSKFFEFYSNLNLKNYVLCTLTGIKMEKKHFLDYYDNLPLIFKQYKFKVKTDAELFNRILYDFEGLCVQDPFDHSHNLTKTINSRKFYNLTEVCRETVTKLSNH